MDEHFRRTARRNIELSVRFRRTEADAAMEQGGKLVDLGLGGVQIRCDRPPAIGTKLCVVLRAPSAWDPLELVGEVRWIDESAEQGPLFGVAFDPLAASDASALFALLEAHQFSEQPE